MGSWGAAQRGMSSPPQKLSDTLREWTGRVPVCKCTRDDADHPTRPAAKIVATITAATRERESGRMVDYDGSLAGY